MFYFVNAIDIICKYEGFNESAYPDQLTGGMPYTLGYGTQFYPDGSPVKFGQYCTREKALEYLQHEINCIEDDLDGLQLHIDNAMRQSLISFIHSVGWKPFLYSSIIDYVEQENWVAVTEEIKCWIFDQDRIVVGNLLERRREEARLFLSHIDTGIGKAGEILLASFRNYSAAPHEIQAIKKLEEGINPYLLAEFANAFQIKQADWIDQSEEVLHVI
jgi:GH24 family phage-related lysozyme (muramidase)